VIDGLRESWFWNDAVKWDMPSFLQHYTLHDSNLTEFRLIPGIGAVLCVSWDLVWNNIIPAGFDSLVIRIRVPYWVNWNQGSLDLQTILEAVSELATPAEREQMMADGTVKLEYFGNQKDKMSLDCSPCVFDESLTKTTLECISGNDLTVLHGREIQLICMNEAGDKTVIPTAFPGK